MRPRREPDLDRLKDRGITEHHLRSFRAPLRKWFRSHGRSFPWRSARVTPYVRILAEVLLQRTQASTVASFLPRFVAKYPSWAAIAAATEEELGSTLQPIGLWRRRAVSLHALAVEMARRRGRFPSDRRELEGLPGVGQYIANAVLLLSHGQPQPLLDSNMSRVLERYFGPRVMADIRDDPYLQTLAAEAVSGDGPVAVNWAILDLAALVCTQRKPGCAACPLSGACRFALSGRHLGD